MFAAAGDAGRDRSGGYAEEFGRRLDVEALAVDEHDRDALVD